MNHGRHELLLKCLNLNIGSLKKQTLTKRKKIARVAEAEAKGETKSKLKIAKKSRLKAPQVANRSRVEIKRSDSL